jgi:prepilin-type N-terminal cleavage/methylation domain-containing protein
MPRVKLAPRRRPRHFSDQAAFTLVELLIAVAISLVMMAAVMTLFANITNSVRNRRATIEMSSQLRHVRNILQQDLLAATSPGLTWQRPESNHGYIEIIEGIHRDSFPSLLTDTGPGSDDSDRNLIPDKLDPALSLVPRNNAAIDLNGNGRIDDDEWSKHLDSDASLSGLNGLGDYDDVLMFTARNEHEPYTGYVPDPFYVRIDEGSENVQSPSDSQINSVEVFGKWDPQTINSPLAEIVWFAVENPSQEENDVANGFFGEPGMRTIYRRALLIAPWINPYRFVDRSGVVHNTFQLGGSGAVFVAEPGLVRILGPGVTSAGAVAALIAFQERFDLSVRLEFDPLLDPDNGGRFKIVANTLADLTKRENRYEHHFLRAPSAKREYPFALTSFGSGYSSMTERVQFVHDSEVGSPIDVGEATAHINTSSPIRPVAGYSIPALNLDGNRRYSSRPFAYVEGTSAAMATARVFLNDEGEAVRVQYGPVPLWGKRRGHDVMLSDVLAFDLRVYDPGAPIYQETSTQSSLEPADPGWAVAYDPVIGTSPSAPTIGQGAYVDLGYAFHVNATTPTLPPGSPWILPWFAEARALSHNTGTQLAPGYAVYDTWSLSYENNGWDEDGDGLVDEGTNGLDDPGVYLDGPAIVRLGPDDVGERETQPPYDKPLRGVQIVLRVYERDSRQIRQVRVNQHFMPE